MRVVSDIYIQVSIVKDRVFFFSLDAYVGIDIVVVGWMNLNIVFFTVSAY